MDGLSSELVGGIMDVRTGPTRSGMNSSTKMTLATMKKKPNRVTILGAIQIGSSSTNAFH